MMLQSGCGFGSGRGRGGGEEEEEVSARDGSMISVLTGISSSWKSREVFGEEKLELAFGETRPQRVGKHGIWIIT